jgi:hypothetical protein
VPNISTSTSSLFVTCLFWGSPWHIALVFGIVFGYKARAMENNGIQPCLPLYIYKCGMAILVFNCCKPPPSRESQVIVALPFNLLSWEHIQNVVTFPQWCWKSLHDG